MRSIDIIQEAWVGSTRLDRNYPLQEFADYDNARVYFPSPESPTYGVQWAGTLCILEFPDFATAFDHVASELTAQ